MKTFDLSAQVDYVRSKSVIYRLLFSQIQSYDNDLIIWITCQLFCLYVNNFAYGDVYTKSVDDKEKNNYSIKMVSRIYICRVTNNKEISENNLSRVHQ